MLKSHTQFAHGKPTKLAVLLINLGTPDAANPAAVRKFLAEFLSDPRVVEIPRAVWLPILYGFILPFRPKAVSKQYEAIWTERGSPIRYHIDDIAIQVKHELITHYGCDESETLVLPAMSYGTGRLADIADQLRVANVDRVVALPLYPQYASSTTGSVFENLMRLLSRWRWIPRTSFIQSYHDEPDYIEAIAKSISTYWDTQGRGDKLMFSFHGVPKKSLLQGDPYFCQCQKTARLVAEKLSLEKDQYEVCFQSRFGRAEWLQPYTEPTLIEWAKHGVKNVDVVCPGFSVDCLETLFEIAQEYGHVFKENGGESLRYIPALNASSEHSELLARLAARALETVAFTPSATLPVQERAQLAKEKGAH